MSAVLYSFRRCPYAMRGRMGIYAAGLTYEHREVLLRDKPQAMLDASPKGTVPVFICADGTIIEESLDLLFWALEHNDPQGWLTCDIDSARALIATNDGPFKHHLDRYKYASRYKHDAKRGDTDFEHRQQAETHLKPLEAALRQAPYLLGEKQSVADIAIFPFIRQFANTDIEWWQMSPYPELRDWLERHVTSSLFEAVMKKHPQWRAAED